MRHWLVIIGRATLALLAFLGMSGIGACSQSEEERPSTSSGCRPLLDGRGFAGYLLVEEEPAAVGAAGFYCVFVEQKYRTADAALQVPARRVLYEPATDSFSEMATAVPATQDCHDAPIGR